MFAYGALLLLLTTASCSFRDEAYTFGSEKVGPITPLTRFEEIGTLFPEDSVVTDTVELRLGVPYYNYNVYRSRDSLLLVVSPHKDSIGKVGSIRIADGLYTTREGLGPGSTFGEFARAYELGSVQPGVFRIGVEVRGENFLLLIPRTELPESLQLPATPVDKVQIPDEAKVEFITVSW